MIQAFRLASIHSVSLCRSSVHSNSNRIPVRLLRLPLSLSPPVWSELPSLSFPCLSTRSLWSLHQPEEEARTIERIPSPTRQSQKKEECRIGVFKLWVFEWISGMVSRELLSPFLKLICSPYAQPQRSAQIYYLQLHSSAHFFPSPNVLSPLSFLLSLDSGLVLPPHLSCGINLG